MGRAKWVVTAVIAAAAMACQAPPEVPASLKTMESTQRPSPTPAVAPAASAPSGWELYMEEAGALLPNMAPAEVREMGTLTCRQLNRDWTMENAAAALMDSGAGTKTTLDYLDVLTNRVCTTQRDEYDAWIRSLVEFEPEEAAVVPEAAPERVYVSPDPATVRGWLRGLWNDYLNRDPDSQELDGWTDYYLGVHREAWEAEARGERWDVEARVREAFEREYAAERDFVEDKDRAKESRESVQGGSDTMACMSNPDDPRCDD